MIRHAAADAAVLEGHLKVVLAECGSEDHVSIVTRYCRSAKMLWKEEKELLDLQW